MVASKINVHQKSASKKSNDFYGFSKSTSILDHIEPCASKKIPAPKSSIDGELHVFGIQTQNYKKSQSELLHGITAHWQNQLVEQGNGDSVYLQTTRGPIWMLKPLTEPSPTSISSSAYAQTRDRVGQLWHTLKEFQGMRHLGLFFHDCTDEEIHGALVGIDLAQYRFTSIVRGRSQLPHFKISAFGVTASQLPAAKSVSLSVNLARHLVNLDAAKVNPHSYSEFVAAWFHGVPEMSVEVWGPERLIKERMHLHYGVGQGATHKSHMVHLKYRPRGASRLKRPLAFVGKGVTFDTGGLDIKPASGMRLMKKDMGGSASVVGIANWLVESKCNVACDLYLALAENSVDAESFRPGDVLTARNGLTVEIHNTDAEGRLVMADVFDVATNRPDDEVPSALIDLSTLTGAMRVAVGVEIAGMFANHDELAQLALNAGAKAGDPSWRMPLWDGYKNHLRSSFADIANASDSGFAGAITAALFLQRFVKGQIPWLHFDLYCWTDRAVGALGDVGGNGQGIQMLIELLETVTPKMFPAKTKSPRGK